MMFLVISTSIYPNRDAGNTNWICNYTKIKKTITDVTDFVFRKSSYQFFFQLFCLINNHQVFWFHQSWRKYSNPVLW